MRTMRFTKAYTTFLKVVCILACAVMTLSVCGCSSGKPASAISQIPQYTLPPVKVESQPAQGGSLTFPIPQNPASLNPLKIKNVELHNLYTLIYEQPVRIGTDGKAQPELAETWNVDETGTVWTFKLREGVQWQGGYGELTADDVIYTIGLIKSYTAEQSTYAKYNDSVSDYAKVDDYTVTVTLNSPGYLGVYFMTFPVVCKAYSATGDIGELDPLGSGPYIVTEYDPFAKMLLSVNTEWWKQAPYIQTLTALCYEDHNDELAVFRENLLDFVTTSELTVGTYSNSRHTYIDYMTQYYDCLVPNTSGLFGDVNIRQAISYALDRRDIISKSLLGHAVATDYPIPPDSYLSNASATMYEYNQTKARELLEIVGWKDRDNDGISEMVDGTTITDLQINLLIPATKENTYRHDVAENIKSQLAECGIFVNIVEQDESAYVQSLEAGNFDLALCSFYLDQYPDISFLVGTDGAKNYGGFSDTELDGLLGACISALDEASLKTAYTAMEQRFIETMPQIGLYFKTNALLYDSSIAVTGSIRDLNIYTMMPEWYLYVKNSEGDIVENAVASAAASADAEASPTPTATATAGS